MSAAGPDRRWVGGPAQDRTHCPVCSVTLPEGLTHINATGRGCVMTTPTTSPSTEAAASSMLRPCQVMTSSLPGRHAPFSPRPRAVGRSPVRAGLDGCEAPPRRGTARWTTCTTGWGASSASARSAWPCRTAPGGSPRHGEQQRFTPTLRFGEGPSPQARGAPSGSVRPRQTVGTIPAGAGSTR